MVKKKKIQTVGSFNGVCTTCKLEIDFFHSLEIIAVSSYVTQSSLELRPFHVTRDMSSERVVVVSL